MSRQVHQLVPAERKEIASHPDLQTLLGPPLLLEGEDAAAYAALNQGIRDAVVPKDIIEDIWVRDVVDLVWEAMRLRRFKAKFMNTSADRLIGDYVRAWTTEPELVPELDAARTKRAGGGLESSGPRVDRESECSPQGAAYRSGRDRDADVCLKTRYSRAHRSHDYAG